MAPNMMITMLSVVFFSTKKPEQSLKRMTLSESAANKCVYLRKTSDCDGWFEVTPEGFTRQKLVESHTRTKPHTHTCSPGDDTGK